MADGGPVMVVTRRLLERAMAGEELAIGEITATLQVCAEHAYDALPQGPVLARPEVRLRYVEAGVRLASAHGYSLLHEWDPDADGGFEEYAVVTIHEYFAALRSPTGVFSPDPTDLPWSSWSPKKVIWALDHGGKLGQQLEELVVKAAAAAVTRVHRRARGRMPIPSLADLQHDVVRQLFETGPDDAGRGRPELARRGHALRSWDPDRGAVFPAWVGLIARNHALRLVRRDIKRPDKAVEGPGPLPERVDGRIEAKVIEVMRFEAVFERLSESDRIIARGKVMGAPSKDIADQVGLSPANVDVRWSRIRKKFRGEP